MTSWSFQAPNPITNFVVGIEFSRPIPSPTLKAIAALHPQFKRDLPRKIEQPTFTFQFPGFPTVQTPGRPTLPAQQQIGSVSFDRIQEDGAVSRSLAVGPNNITFMTAAYSRWVEFQPISDRLVETISKIALQDVDATGVLLTAINKFEWIDTSSRPNLGNLLNQSSKYFAPNMLSCVEHCHSFHGYLSHVSSPIDARYIQNININTVDGTESENIVNVVFSHRTLFSSPLGLDSNLFPGRNRERGIFQEMCNMMHDCNNRLFADVINPEISRTVPGLSYDA